MPIVVITVGIPNPKAIFSEVVKPNELSETVVLVKGEVSLIISVKLLVLLIISIFYTNYY